MSMQHANDVLQSIGVKVEPATGDDIDVLTLNVVPLLHEVRHALERLIATGEATTIDLGAIPLAQGELEKIDAALGVGEVKALLEALGPSRIYETQFSGVWRITHLSAAEDVVGQYIEITRMPEVLLAQDPDMRTGLIQLTEKLGGAAD
jgi:hydrogenase-1 operon protein HyaF